MSIVSRIVAASVMALYMHAVSAYGIQTHASLSEAAFDQSGLSKDTQLLQNLDLKSSDRFLNSQDPDPRTIKELIRDGARFEDNGIQPRFHFYDPIYNTGLIWNVQFVGSPDWALEDRFSSPSQGFSFSDARQYLYNALTLPTKEMRERNFGSAFEALGHVIVVRLVFQVSLQVTAVRLRAG